MDPQLTGLKKTAALLSKRALGMFVEANQMISDNPSPCTVMVAIELNDRAIQECQRAINTIDFIQRYDPPEKAAADACLKRS